MDRPVSLRARSAAVLLPLLGMFLLMPPFIGLFTARVYLFGVPLIVIYLFGVWLFLLLAAAGLARHLAGEAPPDAPPQPEP